MSLTNKTILNLSAIGALQVFARTLNSITLIILARLLLPSDFGIVAIAGILITIMDQFKDFGIGKAIIHRKDNVEDAFISGFNTRLIISLALFCVVFLIAPIWGNFFNDQTISSIVRIFAIVLILENFSFIPNLKLSKELRFKKIIIPESLGYISYSVVAVFLAYNGYSFWSIVYGKIAQSIMNCLSYWIISPWKFHIHFDKKIAKDLLSYGKYVIGAGLFYFISSSLENFVIGKVIGAAALGYYLIAYTWATFSGSQVMALTERVLFPTFSKLNEDIQMVRNAYLKVLKYTSIISIPITFGIFGVAPEFVNIILGEKWAPSILPLQVLCIVGVLSALNSTTGSVYNSIGKPQIPAIVNGINLFLMIMLILPAAKIYGIIGIAALEVFLGIIITYLNFGFIGKYLMIAKYRFIEIIMPQIVSAVLMTILILIIKLYINRFNIFSEFSIVYLIFLMLSGIIAYFMFLFILTKGRLRDDVKILTSNLTMR
jgi:O-antigen/teichoic acid export membrane protein